MQHMHYLLPDKDWVKKTLSLKQFQFSEHSHVGKNITTAIIQIPASFQ